MTPIRSFVVRIYRQGRTGVAGVVEDVQSGRSRPFHSLAELWDALFTTRRRGARTEAPPSPPPTED